ncbi:MAG: hypothetical protein ACE5HH_04190, partial [Candidatus Hydrothermarchaeales archaeon]
MSRIGLFIIFIIVASLTFAGLTYYYYEGFIGPKKVSLPELESITAPRHVEGISRGALEKKGAKIVFDAAHENAFTASEISTVLERFNAMGAGYEFIDSQEGLEKALKYADAFIVISPTTAYSKEEVSSVKDFLRKGGRLALFVDPTRESRTDSIASQLGIMFASDYLYNINENAGNYRHIYVDDFIDSPVTAGLERITLFTASSITSVGGVAFTDSRTVSSLRGDGPHSTITMVDDSILAIADQSFMEQPNDRVTDNGLLISNIAAFLGEGKRRYTLEDFPFFFSDVSIRYSNASLLEEALEVKGVLVDAGIKSSISQKGSEETIFIGLFNQSKKELEELEDIIVDNTIVAGGVEFDINSTAIIYQRDKSIWILSQEEESINNLIALLKNG